MGGVEGMGAGTGGAGFDLVGHPFTHITRPFQSSHRNGAVENRPIPFRLMDRVFRGGVALCDPNSQQQYYSKGLTLGLTPHNRARGLAYDPRA